MALGHHTPNLTVPVDLLLQTYLYCWLVVRWLVGQTDKLWPNSSTDRESRCRLAWGLVCVRVTLFLISLVPQNCSSVQLYFFWFLLPWVESKLLDRPILFEWYCWGLLGLMELCLYQNTGDLHKTLEDIIIISSSSSIIILSYCYNETLYFVVFSDKWYRNSWTDTAGFFLRIVWHSSAKNTFCWKGIWVFLPK